MDGHVPLRAANSARTNAKMFVSTVLVLQNFAQTASNFLQAGIPRLSGMAKSLKLVVKENLELLMAERRQKPADIKAYYLRGKKKGQRISPRAIAYLFEVKDDSPGPSLDILEGVAAYFEVKPWALLIDHSQSATADHVTIGKAVVTALGMSTVPGLAPAPPNTRRRQ